MIAKLLCVVTLMNLWLGTNIELPRHDIVVTSSGETIEGKIDTILDGVIKIKTKNGDKIIIRQGSVFSPRDIIDTGIVKNTRYSGTVRYLDEEFLQIETATGKISIKAPLVRKIVVSEEITVPSLDL